MSQQQSPLTSTDDQPATATDTDMATDMVSLEELARDEAATKCEAARKRLLSEQDGDGEPSDEQVVLVAYRETFQQLQSVAQDYREADERATEAASWVGNLQRTIRMLREYGETETPVMRKYPGGFSLQIPTEEAADHLAAVYDEQYQAAMDSREARRRAARLDRQRRLARATLENLEARWSGDGSLQAALSQVAGGANGRGPPVGDQSGGPIPPRNGGR